MTKSIEQKFNTAIEVSEWLRSYHKFGIKPGLQRMKWLLNELNNPHYKLKIIHVAGTNGKGSTCKYIANALSANSLRTGLFTSPYLDSILDNFTLNQQLISEQQLCRVADKLRSKCRELPLDSLGEMTEFELVTVLALVSFAEQEADYVVLETGLGGRLDATNVVKPVLSIITSIGLDHTQILGDTLGAIAAEKAGIIKSNTPVISGVGAGQPTNLVIDSTNLITDSSNPSQVINDYAYKMGAPIIEVKRDFIYQITELNHTEMIIEVTSKLFENGKVTCKSKMLATYQAHNISLAIMALHQLGLLNQQSLQALADTSWPCRFERVSEQPPIIIDGAHNLHALLALDQALLSLYGKAKIIWCVGFLADKDISGMIEIIVKRATHIIICEPDNERAASTSSVHKIIKRIVENSNLKMVNISNEIKIIEQPDIELAVELAKNTAKKSKNDIVCIAGSLYMTGRARRYLRRVT